MLEMKENSYSPGAFTIELNDECYPIAHDMGFQDEKAQSGLLHEYIHYLQDTVTYYGVKYRTELYSKNVNMTVAGGNGNSLLSLPEFAGMKPINIDANGRPTFEGELIGATAIKENMARQAEFYVYGTPQFDNSKAVIYTGITTLVRSVSEQLSESPLALFVIDDCCLGTTDPAASLMVILKNMETEKAEALLKLSDLELAHGLYDLCRNILENNGIEVDAEIDQTPFESEEWCYTVINNITCRIYPSEEDCKKDIDAALKLSSILDEQSRVNAQVRHANHTALADSLMDFKQNRDLEQLFAKYGTPLIKRTGSCDPKESNVDIYLQ